jgi:dihydrodipicolinate synthase/N-acetylneuraminate lyase
MPDTGKPDRRPLEAHAQHVGNLRDRADIPWVLQDYPLTLTVQMAPSVIRRIIQDNPWRCANT